MGELRLGKIATIVDCEHKTAPLVESSDYISVRTTDIANGKIDFQKANRVSEETFSKWTKRAIPTEGDIILAREAPVGEVGWVGRDRKVCLGQRTVLIRPNSERIVPKFLLYYLANPSSKYDFRNQSAGSVVEHLNVANIRDFELRVNQTLPEQKAIAEVLSSLDDKIDLLHRQNKTLESLAQTLFRQWFIEEAEDSWPLKKLEELCSITRGSSPRPIIEFVKNGTVPWIKIADATGSDTFFIDRTREFIIEAGVKNSVTVSPGDLIMSNSATCGFPFFVELNGCIHDGWLLFRDFKEISKLFAFFFLKQIYRELNNFADGSVQNNLNTGILKEYPIKIPPKQLIEMFDDEAGVMLDKIRRNVYQARTLAKLRDSLLPKLMSGEARVASV